MDQPARKPFIGYLHAFRGVAILSIMGAHAWSGLGFVSGAMEGDPAFIWLYAATEALFHGTTLFFALISGILVTRVLGGMSWKQYFRNKLTNVLMPYVVVSTVLTVIAWPEISAWIRDNHMDLNFPMVLAHQLATGNAAVHLWYIPVLIVLFLLTPALKRLLAVRHGVLLLALSAVPLVVSRSVFPDLLSLKTVVYFLGAYGLGMYLGERLEGMLAFVDRHRVALLLVFASSLIVNFALFRWSYLPTGFVSAQQVVVYLNKITAALLLLRWLHAREEHLPRALLTLGTYAFSLYFLHFSIMWELDMLLVKLFPQMDVPQLVLAGLAVYVLATAIALLLSVGLQKLFGRHSRMLIGV